MAGLPAGAFRARALDLFGRVTFASGVTVRDGLTAEPARLWAKVDLDEPDSREVMGFVRWESGRPVEKAAVFMQNTYNFRKFVRRVETDIYGYFRFSDVPGDEPYFAFALPPGESNAMRIFEYFGVVPPKREVWKALTLHPHRVVGDLAGAPWTDSGQISSVPTGRAREATAPKLASSPIISASNLLLVRIEGKAERVVWTFRAEPSGKFLVANVPHGRYCVQVLRGDAGKTARSLWFDVGDSRIETAVQWSSQW